MNQVASCLPHPPSTFCVSYRLDTSTAGVAEYEGCRNSVDRLDIVIPDAMVDDVVNTITKTAKTGKIGDGKVFVLDVTQAVRVRTGETGDDAL